MLYDHLLKHYTLHIHYKVQYIFFIKSIYTISLYGDTQYLRKKAASKSGVLFQIINIEYSKVANCNQILYMERNTITAFP